MAGICYTPEVLQALLNLCQTYQIHIISDEVYALSVWHNKAAPHTPSFTSLLSIDFSALINPGLVHVLRGMSKVCLRHEIRAMCLFELLIACALGLRSQWPSPRLPHRPGKPLSDSIFLFPLVSILHSGCYIITLLLTIRHFQPFQLPFICLG